MKPQWNYLHFFPRPIIIVNCVEKNPNITYPCKVRVPVHYFSIVLPFWYSGLSPTQHLVFLTISKQKSWQFTKEEMSKAAVQVAWISDITLNRFWGSKQLKVVSEIDVTVQVFGHLFSNWPYFWPLLQATSIEPSLSCCQNTVSNFHVARIY